MTRPPIGTDEVVGPSLGAIPGSHPTDQAASHLGASRFDPERDERLCQCFADDEEDRPLTLRQLPGGNYIMLCDECGQRVIDDDPKTWRKLAEAAIMDLRHYADDELPHRRLVSARAYESRFNLLASVDTLPKGQDAQQGLAGTEGSAVAATSGETPNGGRNDPRD